MGVRLSKEQKAAIEHENGPAMILAGPGTGKTTVITNRVKNLIFKKGVPPEKILVVTFSKAASVEMRERFESITEGKMLPVRFGTFHSLFFHILRGAYGLTAKNIISAKLKYRFLEEAIISARYDDVEDKGEFIENIEREIGKIKGEGIDINMYYSTSCPESVFRKIFKTYQEKLRKNRYIDFDDMISYTHALFVARADILDKWREMFDYILVDEFQDINKLQYENLRMLAAPKNNLFIVGDDDQSIYGFRGARPDIMLSFPEEYPGLTRVSIGDNYRCTEQILGTAVNLITHNKTRFEKNIVAKKGKGKAVVVANYPNVFVQADEIIEKIRDYMEKGTPIDEFAVLFRTSRQMNIIARKLMEYNIDFVMKDRVQNIFEHWVAKDLIAYVKIALGDRSRDLFLKVVNKPKRYISRDAIKKSEVVFGELYNYYRDKPYMCDRINEMQNDIFNMKQLAPYAAIDYIYNIIGYKDYLKEFCQERGIDSKDFMDLVEEIREDASDIPTLEDWLVHIEEYGEEMERRANEKKEEEQSGVALMTMHASKGLEFDVVFLPDINEGVVPSSKSTTEESEEEERRLMYVAMTRARKNLHISYVTKRNGRDASPSIFLEEIKQPSNIQSINE
ncbi:ATP-dependent helicase [Eubacterium xylanophilum]|uniref:ATP-dependent helicase n=1 Tax=Eubacterium xylanophilum TaxID=39497 RepID=UPI00047A56DF|nr:ATP-dependent helicase [Eubacterium xylanophilum]